MGGRGSASGIKSKTSGFEWTSNGRKFTVQRTTAGVTLLNGKPSKLSYESLQKSAKGKADYKEISAAEFERRRNARYEERKGVDYANGTGTPWDNRDNRKAARQQRLSSRRRR